MKSTTPRGKDPDVVEVLDTSHMQDIRTKAGTKADVGHYAPLQAKLLEDNRCIVRISRSDSYVDFYALYPL